MICLNQVKSMISMLRDIQELAVTRANQAIYLSQSQLVHLSTMSSSHVFLLWNAQLKCLCEAFFLLFFESNGKHSKWFGVLVCKNLQNNHKRTPYYQKHLTRSKMTVKWKWYILVRCPVREREREKWHKLWKVNA